jgi:hypothetical protein
MTALPAPAVERLSSHVVFAQNAAKLPLERSSGVERHFFCGKAQRERKEVFLGNDSERAFHRFPFTGVIKRN